MELINKIAGRITSRKSQINGATAKKRISNWFQRFKNLLGNEATIEDESEEIAPIFNDIEIRGDPFSMDEYEKVKSTLVSGNACGEDGIEPEILKDCKFDDIILDICNTALVQQDIPCQC